MTDYQVSHEDQEKGRHHKRGVRSSGGYSAADSGDMHGGESYYTNESGSFCPTNPRYKYHVDEKVQHYWCNHKHNGSGDEYNEGKLITRIYAKANKQ